MESETQPPTDIESDTEGTYISETQDQTSINVDDEVQQNEKTAPTSSVEKDPSKQLLEEVTFTSTGNNKNSGGNPYYDILYNRVKEAEKKGVAAKSLKNFVLSQNPA
ncbi:hypothetical protein L2E82_11228 [Cichorium intybus]|uniref:Uncharacterized protein n=1 Tax=Cichorium intybus TaxID=13427 RepID=A0ACB9GCQ7_CICIN|nr:hypothetical protein L2E82_11228 [Cichorium intybus]